jgi:hypothetical protein
MGEGVSKIAKKVLTYFMDGLLWNNVQKVPFDSSMAYTTSDTVCYLGKYVSWMNKKRGYEMHQ